LISNAFTEDRLQVIRTLSSQCAVSLENGVLFNNLQDLNHNLLQFSEACSRFVPTSFINLLQKSSVVDVLLGDNVSIVCTILFTDIRSFSTLSENFTPQETFAFLNCLFGKMAPVIRRNGGIIDKFIGDSIMALFPRSPEDAIQSAVEMLQALADFNETCKEKFGFDKVNIGIGIHTGNLMLGTIGEEGRMDVTVVSDAVNLASRLENLTNAFGANILVSNSSLTIPCKYDSRYLGKVIVKGKKQHILLYEVCSGTSEHVALKMNLKESLVKALELYAMRKFQDAKKLYQEILNRNPADKVLHIYLASCENYIQHPEVVDHLPANWDGALMLTKDGRLESIV